MIGKALALVAIAVLGLFALACTENTTIQTAQEQTDGISVSGSGTATGEPDVAVLTLGVEAEAPSVGEARTQAAESMDAMLAALREGGLAEEDIQTTRFSVFPQYDFVEGRQELRGFAVNNTVTAKIRTIDTTGEIIDAAVTAGGDLARIDQLQFTIDDPTALEDEARREAMADARARAETLAEEAGVDLGDPRAINESGGALPRVFEGAIAADIAFQEDADTPISIGELEVRVNVQVVYGLE